ncbi:protein 5NUC-like isoform X2 [Dermacentor albipictus]|uniref:protein 5NUC-like isoform X2 n=1 Tax=Dermacentor albipictus TaxID=60249 RepID=UPI0031FC70B1
MHVASATLIAILCFTLSSAQSGKGNTNGRLKLTILHTNDIHSRILESDKRGMQCNEEKRKNGKCFGGIARIAYQVRKLKNAARNVLFVNAGDFYQGTLWYSILKHKIVSAAMSQMSYDVVCLGNHEFDDGPEGLAPFLRKMKEAKIRVLGTNLDTSAEPSFRHISLPRSTVYNIEGRQVAFLGVVTTETITIAKPGRIRILPEIESINNEIRRLKQQRINIFFLISHVGFDVDQKIAAACPDLDLIIGGHTNTFLYTGKPPVDDKPEGPYPVVYKRRDGTQCLIVQDFRFGKYLGYLRMEINRDGVITHWAGSPILLSQDVPQDLQVLNSMMSYKQTVDEAIKRTVGSTKVLLEADEKLCRYRECNSVNLMADSFLDFYANRNSPVSSAWSVVNAAVINGGIARDSIRQKCAHVVYDFRQPNGRRVASLKVLCANCSVPVYKPVRKERVYSIVTTSFIANGGDGFVFGSGVAKRTEGVSALDVFAKYFSKTSPVKTPEEERVIVLNLPKRGVGSP